MILITYAAAGQHIAFPICAHALQQNGEFMGFIYKIIVLFISFTALLSSFLPWHDTEPRADVNVLGVFEGFSGQEGASKEIKLEQEAAVNCFVIRENQMKIKGFLLEAKINGVYEVVAGGDTAGTYRLCDFDEVTASEFRFTVTQCTEGGFTVNSMELCFRDAVNDDFRVVSYLVANGLDASYTPDEGHFKASTDVIIFGIATFNEEGEIILNNEENLASIIGKCTKANPGLRMHLNILGPSQSADTWEEEQQLQFEKHALGMRNNKEALIANIVSVLDEYGFDGVYFDYEFPVSDEAKIMFSSFLVSLDKALGDKELGCAMASWCSVLTPAARRALDSVEVMAYDIFDDYGYHAAFAAAYREVRIFLENGYRKEQLHLGLPFYARPTDAAAEWPIYNVNADKLGEFENLAIVESEGRTTPAYFNGRQLIRDKTAYALSTGLGGVMIWHLSCDTQYDCEYSLYAVIDKTLAR